MAWRIDMSEPFNPMSAPQPAQDEIAAVRTTRARVALTRGDERVANVRAALAAVMDDLPWSTLRAVVVKPNLVVYDAPHAVTHRDTLDAVLGVIRQRYTGSLTIAEGCAVQSTTAAFRHHDYPGLAAKYDCALVDLNADATVDVQVVDRHGAPLHLRLARTIYASDCRVSLSVPKTHDTVLMTGAVKNMIMAALVNRRHTSARPRPLLVDWIGALVRGHGDGWGSDKRAMHQSYPAMNLNLAALAPHVMPHLAVLDGFVAMEGDGPVWGDPVPWGIALAGADALAVDTLAATLMGFDLQELGYLHYCAQLGLGVHRREEMTFVGNVAPDTVARRFRRHSTGDAQAQWAVPDAPAHLQAAPVAAPPASVAAD
jgi:uncharacterized protein (DUF362 family)